VIKRSIPCSKQKHSSSHGQIFFYYVEHVPNDIVLIIVFLFVFFGCLWTKFSYSV